MQKNIQITSVEKFKEGNTNGKDWCIFKVVCENDSEMSEFSTFNDYRDKIGQQFQGDFEYQEKWKNWKELSPKQAEESSKHDELLNAIREVWNKVDEIGKKIDVLGVPRTLKQGELEEPIRDEEQEAGYPFK